MFLNNRISIIDKILIIFNNCLRFLIVNLIYNYLAYSYSICNKNVMLFVNIFFLKNKIFNATINREYSVHKMSVKQCFCIKSILIKTSFEEANWSIFIHVGLFTCRSKNIQAWGRWWDQIHVWLLLLQQQG